MALFQHILFLYICVRGAPEWSMIVEMQLVNNRTRIVIMVILELPHKCLQMNSVTAKWQDPLPWHFVAQCKPVKHLLENHGSDLIYRYLCSFIFRPLVKSVCGCDY